YSAAEHLQAVVQHVGQVLFDFAVLNKRPFPPSMRKRYAAEHAEPVVNDLAKIRALGVSPVCVPLLQAEDGVARHDSLRLSRLLLELAARRPRRAPAGPARRRKAALPPKRS
ncbi:MAG TPA: 2-phospho-L-lactate transferase CofD family protein, partial [Terriglobia bacterium]|nr:2-phospho-L-lactate transferase CofD family protein [Terriglobia bacterium]